MKHLVLIAHNLRSCHNVGSLLRTAEGLGVESVWLTGYTPHPAYQGDLRLPHESAKITKQIQKTALGAEDYQTWFYRQEILPLLNELKSYGYTVAALEQTNKSKSLIEVKTTDKLALIVGREVEGIEEIVLDTCDIHYEIPMAGKKESFNVAIAAAMALYHLKFA